MNVNVNVPALAGGRGRARQPKAIPVQRSLMGPPSRPGRKRRDTATSHSTTKTMSNINWRLSQRSIPNNSSTPRTSSSSRSHFSSEPESRIVIALSEGRGEAVGEVGIAAINIARPSLMLCQISDTQSYINTLTKINILNPSEILIPLTFIETFTSNRLIEKVKEQCRDVKITGVARSTFNKITGLQYVKQLCVPSMDSILLILQHRFYALAAAAALLTYTESTLYISYARESVKIEYQESEGSTIIDVATADRLELVASARPTTKKRYSCLLDVLDYCVTKIGSRTLRTSILQPPCSVPDIEARLDCVTELVKHSDMLAAIQVALSKLTNIDQLLALATVLPDQAQNCSERQINYVLLLNTVLEQIAPLKDIFANSQQPFFVELRNTLRNPAFAEIKEVVRNLIHVDAHPGKGQYGMFQRCFAIKSGINSLLDLVRKSYSERLDDMRKYVTSLGERYSLPLTLHNNYKKGYHIVLNLNAHQKRTLKAHDLPPECFQVERFTNSYTMKTQDLINLSNRVEDIMMEILKMSNIMIHKLLIQIRGHIGIFYKLCEDVAKLDMLQSLAKASSAMQYVRPQFADYLEVVQGRHPLLDVLCATEPTSNSTYASKEYNINIITGPNGSGKSIIVRQVILIQVMAQVGCYVPAKSATLRVSDRILARVYLEDNMDYGASAFVLEMKEIQYFLTVLTKNTLIVIDELCRSTSVEEGTALAMAVCEKLMTKSAFVFFTTHFKMLTKLQDLHFSVKTWQLETLTETADDQVILNFTYSAIPGVTSLEHYGIFLAKGSWPENIIQYAEEILNSLSKSQKKPLPHIEQINTAARLKYDLEAELQMLKAKKNLTRVKIEEKLAEYKRNLEHLDHQVEFPLVPPGDQESFICGVQENSNNSAEFVDYFNLQNRDMTDTHAAGNDFPPNQNSGQFFNFQNIQIENFNHSYAPSTRYIPGDVREGTFLQNSCTLEENSAASPPYGSFLNGSLYKPENSDMNFSLLNIFEPEIILETNTQNSSNIVQTRFTFQNDNTTVTTVENVFVAHSFSRENPYLSKEASIILLQSRDNSVIYNESASLYEDAVCSKNYTASRFVNKESGNASIWSDRNSIRSNLSITEQQFSLPLQEDLARTSTPINLPLASFSQPLHEASIVQLENCGKSTTNCFKPISTPINIKGSVDRSKSTSTKSDSIKWFAPDQKHSPSTSKTSQSNDSSKSLNQNNVFATPTTRIKRPSSNQNDGFATPSTSKSLQSKTKDEQCNNNQILANPNISKLSTTAEVHKSYSEADITEILNEVQSCSEYFTDAQDWDSVDEEVNSKMTQTVKTLDKPEDSKHNLKEENATVALTRTEKYNSDLQHSKKEVLLKRKLKRIVKRKKNLIKSRFTGKKVSKPQKSSRIKTRAKTVSFRKSNRQSGNDKNPPQLPENQQGIGNSDMPQEGKVQTLQNESIINNAAVTECTKMTCTKIFSPHKEKASQTALEIPRYLSEKYTPDKPAKLQNKISQTSFSYAPSQVESIKDVPQSPYKELSLIPTSELENEIFRTLRLPNEISRTSVNKIPSQSESVKNIPRSQQKEASLIQVSELTEQLLSINSQRQFNKTSSQDVPQIKNDSKNKQASNSQKNIFEQSQNISLEMLGDIHLELFSDQSLFEECEPPKEIIKSPPQTQSTLPHIDEYETAISTLECSQDSTFFGVPKFTSTPIENLAQNLSQKPKRRRLGYLTKNSPILQPIVKEKAQQEPIQPITISSTSDFESSTDTKKPNPKNIDVSEKQQKPKLRRRKIQKFKPPRQLTKKEIEHDFYEQDRKMLESNDSSKYLEHIMNRPSVKQVQQTKHIASIHKTSSGILVLPAKDKRVKTQKRKFVTPLKKRSEDFDVTLFSDKNSGKFNQFMSSNSAKKVIHTRQDVANQFIKSEVVSKKENAVAGSKIVILQNIKLVSASNLLKKSNSNDNLQNDSCTAVDDKNIDHLVEKYLNPEVESTETANLAVALSSRPMDSQEFNSSIFSQSTVALDITNG